MNLSLILLSVTLCSGLAWASEFDTEIAAVDGDLVFTANVTHMDASEVLVNGSRVLTAAEMEQRLSLLESRLDELSVGITACCTSTVTGEVHVRTDTIATNELSFARGLARDGNDNLFMVSSGFAISLSSGGTLLRLDASTQPTTIVWNVVVFIPTVNMIMQDVAVSNDGTFVCTVGTTNNATYGGTANQGGLDAFVDCYSASTGDFLWSYAQGTAMNDFGKAIAIGPVSNRVYMVVSGINELNAAPVFLVELDSNGVLLHAVPSQDILLAESIVATTNFVFLGGLSNTTTLTGYERGYLEKYRLWSTLAPSRDWRSDVGSMSSVARLVVETQAEYLWLAGVSGPPPPPTTGGSAQAWDSTGVLMRVSLNSGVPVVFRDVNGTAPLSFLSMALSNDDERVFVIGNSNAPNAILGVSFSGQSSGFLLPVASDGSGAALVIDSGASAVVSAFGDVVVSTANDRLFVAGYVDGSATLSIYS